MYCSVGSVDNDDNDNHDVWDSDVVNDDFFFTLIKFCQRAKLLQSKRVSRPNGRSKWSR